MTRFCHGSPGANEECVTERTPPERWRELRAGVAEATMVIAHTHVSYDRVVDGVRLLNAASVGLPYEGAHGAYRASSARTSSTRRTTTWSGPSRSSARAVTPAR